MIPDWQLPPGVDRGLADYMASGEMVAGYDAMMAASPLASADVAFCEKWFPTPGTLVDLGCGTGRLARHFAARGYAALGVDLSDEMLAVARSLPSPLAGEGPGVRGLDRTTTHPDSSSDLLPPPLGKGGRKTGKPRLPPRQPR